MDIISSRLQRTAATDAVETQAAPAAKTIKQREMLMIKIQQGLLLELNVPGIAPVLCFRQHTEG